MMSSELQYLNLPLVDRFFFDPVIAMAILILGVGIEITLFTQRLIYFKTHETHLLKLIPAYDLYLFQKRLEHTPLSQILRRTILTTSLLLLFICAILGILSSHYHNSPTMGLIYLVFVGITIAYHVGYAIIEVFTFHLYETLVGQDAEQPRQLRGYHRQFALLFTVLALIGFGLGAATSSLVLSGAGANFSYQAVYQYMHRRAEERFLNL